MEALAGAAKSPGKVYFTGGATALLLGFREQTIDLDIKLDPEPEGVFEAIASLKNRLDLNIKLACPADFIPADPQWREHAHHIASIGRIEFYHYDFVLQALAKLERGHAQDLADVTSFVRGGHVTLEELRERLSQLEPDLLRYPAIDPGQFRKQVLDFIELEKVRGKSL